jgi:hypothetical protein
MIGLAALALASAQPQLAKAGDCGWVRGHYVVANGSRIHRIFVLGAGHALSLDIADESVPRALKRLYETKRFVPFTDEMFGDFYVCARERRLPEHMQRVDLKRTKNLRIVGS